MSRFPADFAPLLSPAGRRILDGDLSQPPLDSTSWEHVLLLPGIVDEQRAVECLGVLERDFDGQLHEISAQIQPEATGQMVGDARATISTAMHVKSLVLTDLAAPLQQRAERSGLLEMLRSESIHRFAEAVTGFHLEPGPDSRIICFEHGHYVGPHYDHDPESDWARDGYVDLRLVFSNDAVEHHWLIHEQQGHLSRISDLNLSGAVAVFKQPFWHQTTPLVGKRGREREARGWLISQAFRILERSRRSKTFVPVTRLTARPPTPDGYPLQSDVRLSESLLWTWQRAYYERHGPTAWQVVPSNITTNPFIAKAYARVVLGFLRDCTGARNGEPAMGPFQPEEPIYIFELGAGSGRLGFAFLQHLLPLKRLLGLDDVQVRYVMTDQAQSTIEQWVGSPELRPFVESGVLDFARYDLGRGGEIQLRTTGEVIARDRLRNPIVVFANYVFDTIEHDLFRVERGRLHEGRVTLCSTTSEPDPTDPTMIERLKVDLQYRPCENEYYDDPALNQLLAQYTRQAADMSFSVPLGALRSIRRFVDLSGGRLLLLAADKGYSSEEELAAANDLDIALTGSLSLMVNFHALRLYAENLGGFLLETPRPQPTLAVVAAVVGASPDAVPETRFAFDDSFAGFGPYDRYQLVASAPTEGATPPTEYVLSLLRLSQWDPQLITQFAGVLREGGEALSPLLQADLAAGLNRAWELYLPTTDEDDLAFEIATILQQIGRPAAAMAYYERSLHRFGDHPATLYNLGACHYQLARPVEALTYFDRALVLQPDHELAGQWSDYVRAELGV